MTIAFSDDLPPAKPVVKWAGGKTKLIPEIEKHLPRIIGAYLEPFIGGGALFFHLQSLGRVQMAMIADVNQELIDFYRAIAERPEAVIGILEHKGKGPNGEPPFTYVKENFLYWRARKPSDLGQAWRAARFLYLNRTCFNGLYRVNRAGQFNVPFGDYKNPKICDAAALRSASRALVEAQIEQGDFDGEGVNLEVDQACAIRVGGGFVCPSVDVMYLDPPYDPVSDTANFTSYTEGGFSWADQERLAKFARCVVDRGFRVIASNAATARIRELWAGLGFVIHEVKAARAINSDAGKRGAVSEFLMVGGS